MKKNGFTLAEVLITLAIIGVVATLTLPALMTNTAEQQAKTALKKGINTLTEAAQMNQSIAGFDYASLTETSTEKPDAQSLYGLLASRASLDYTKNGDAKGRLESHQGASTDAVTEDNFVVFFRDGSALMYPKDMTSVSKATVPGIDSKEGTVQMEDGLVYGITAIYDTNGAKGPNIMSNCKGNALGATGDSITQKDGANVADVCTKSKRVIKDQFGVRLRGGYAVPNGAAARWAFEN